MSQMKRKVLMTSVMIGLLTFLYFDQKPKSSTEKQSASVEELSILLNKELNTLKLGRAQQAKFEQFKTDADLIQQSTWSYDGETSPRSQIQNNLRELAQDHSLETLSISSGREKQLKGFDLMMALDFPVNGSFDQSMQTQLYEFLRVLATQKKIYHWKSLSVNYNNSQVRFSGVLRTYLVEPMELKQVGAQK